LGGLDPNRYWTDFAIQGCSNYALTLILASADLRLRDRVEKTLHEHRVEFRRGTSGGGNQLRQPYLRTRYGDLYRQYPRVDHVHHFGWYIGNYPDLEPDRIHDLCQLLNHL
jgi:CDP-6-deoxy-D-xylo-4-hexulose-3-dehydrase